MSKAIISTTVVSPAAPVAPAPAQTVATRPHTIVITERTGLAFAIAAVHVRAGYIFSADYAPEVFPSMGQATITLHLGNPDANAIALAEATTAHAVALQRVEFQKEVEQCARQMVEQAAREEKQKQLAAEVAEAKKALRKLEAAAAEA